MRSNQKMSIKTLRFPHNSPIVLAAARSALRRTALACAVNVLMLAPAASYALELGDATMVSGLGQTLLVEIPYRLSASEQLTPACISLASAMQPAGALPTYTRASRVSITPTHIQIFGDSRVVEPLIGLNVDVHCESAPRFVRSYELFVDPPVNLPATQSNGVRFAAAPTAAPRDTAVPAESRPAASAEPTRSVAPTSAETQPTARTNASPRARGQTGGALTQGQTYVVVRGDTLSGIAARVGDRPTLRETAEAIFAANSAAFTRGNRDLLEAGRSITIPLMTAAPAALPAAPLAVPAPAVPEAELSATSSSAVVAPAPASAEPLPADKTAPSAVAPAAIELPAAPITVEPSAAPAQTPVTATPVAASPTSTSGRSSIWLTALLALGAAMLLSAPVLFIRRRKPEPEAPSTEKARTTTPRQLVDPIAGFHVVEGARTPTVKIETIATPTHAATPPVAARAVTPDEPEAPADALDVGAAESVDLDVGAPMVDERADWFGDRVDTAAATVATPLIDPAMLEATATERVPELDRTSTALQSQLTAANDDREHTLTVAEVAMLREDYETEHTLTQQTNKELRDALADLEATQASLKAKSETATLEIPRQAKSENITSKSTRKKRSSH